MNANESKRLDDFHTDMLMASMHDTVEDMQAADDDYSPVPPEFWGMSFGEVVAICDENDREEADAIRAQNEIPYRWQ